MFWRPQFQSSDSQGRGANISRLSSSFLDGHSLLLRGLATSWLLSPLSYPASRFLPQLLLGLTASNLCWPVKGCLRSICLSSNWCPVLGLVPCQAPLFLSQHSAAGTQEHEHSLQDTTCACHPAPQMPAAESGVLFLFMHTSHTHTRLLDPRKVSSIC